MELLPASKRCSEHQASFPAGQAYTGTSAESSDCGIFGLHFLGLRKQSADTGSQVVLQLLRWLKLQLQAVMLMRSRVPSRPNIIASHCLA